MRRLAEIFCAFILIATASPPASGSPMEFFVDDSDEQSFVVVTKGGVFDIYASGEIDEGTSERFLAFVKANKIEAAKVHFNSPGGSLAEGIKLGRTIRALEFYTTVGLYNPNYVEDANKNALCASACAYAFAGGTSRFLDQFTGSLGIHQFYSSGKAVSGEAVQQISGLIVAYLDEMGIDAKAFTLSTIADRNGMIWLTPEDAVKLRFANNGVEAPVAEIRLAEMRPYLRVQQNHHNVTTRVLFSCENKQILMSFGIVTDPEMSELIMAFPKRSYLELDSKEFLVVLGADGVEARESVVWIGRNLTPDMLVRIANASKIDGWIDGSGAVRWGAQLDLPAIRDKILSYGRQCFAT